MAKKATSAPEVIAKDSKIELCKHECSHQEEKDCTKECVNPKTDGDAAPKKIEAAPLTLTIEAANNFQNIVDVIMVGDPRGNSIQTHFSNMIVSGNPHLKEEQKKALN